MTCSPTNLRNLVETGSHFYGQFAESSSADPYTNCSYENFRMGRSRLPDPYVRCPYNSRVR